MGTMNMREKVSRSVVSELVQTASVLITSASVIFEYYLIIEAERFPLIRFTRITFSQILLTPQSRVSQTTENCSLELGPYHECRQVLSQLYSL